MRDDLLAAIKPREETVKLGKNVLTVRELETAADEASAAAGAAKSRASRRFFI